MNGHMLVVVPPPDGQPSPDTEAMARMVLSMQQHSLAGQLGSRSGALGIDEVALLAAAETHPPVAAAVCQLRDGGVQLVPGQQLFGSVYVQAARHRLDYHAHGIGSTVRGSGGAGHPGHVRETVRKEHQLHVIVRIGHGSFALLLGGAGGPEVHLQVPHGSVMLLTRAGCGEFALEELSAANPDQPISERLVFHGVTGFRKGQDVLISLQAKALMAGDSPADALLAAGLAFVRSGADAAGGAGGAALPTDLCVPTPPVWEAWPEQGPAGPRYAELLAAVNESKRLGVLSVIGAAKSLSKKQCFERIRERQGSSGTGAWDITQPLLRRWLVADDYAHSLEVHAQAVRKQLTPVQLATLHEACSDGKLAEALAAASRTVLASQLSEEEDAKAVAHFGGCIVKFRQNAQMALKIVKYKAGIPEAVSHLEATLNTAAADSRCDPVRSLMGDPAWCQAQVEAMRDLWRGLHEAREANQADEAFMRLWEARRGQVAVDAAALVPDEAGEALKRVWELDSLREARRVQGTILYDGTFSDGSVHEINGMQLNGHKVIASGKAFGSDPKTAGATGGSRSAGVQGGRQFDRPAKREKVQIVEEEAGINLAGISGRDFGRLKTNLSHLALQPGVESLVLPPAEPPAPKQGNGPLLPQDQREFIGDLVHERTVVQKQKTNVHEVLVAVWERFGSKAIHLTMTQWQSQVSKARKRLGKEGHDVVTKEEMRHRKQEDKKRKAEEAEPKACRLVAARRL